MLDWRSRRRAAGLALGLGLVVALSAAMVPVRSDISRASPALVLVVPILLAGLVGGRLEALLTAVGAAGAFNVAFIPPYWTFTIHAPDDLVAVVVFAFVALVVGTLVAREGDRRHSAEERSAELQALNAELQALHEERERLAEGAARATVLQRVDEQRAALLRSVSHDLRTPLAAIHAVVSDLLGGPNYDDATRVDLLTLVAEETERLDRLVANLLSLSRIEAGALRPDSRALAIDDLVHESVKRLSRFLAGRRVQVDLPEQIPLVRGDYTQLQQVVVNLIENASRHTPPNSFVWIGARETARCVEVWIDDEGPGILPFERQRIFEPFRIGEGSTSSGIGLAICKAIIEAHGGEIGVDGSPSGGARFSFTVPKA